MVTRTSPTMLRRQLGAELRRLRDQAKRTVSDVATQLGWSESKLSRIETAHNGIRMSDLDRLLTLYGTGDPERKRLASLNSQARQRAWWEAYGDALPDVYETYIGFEAEATSILNYEAQVVPGLLQTTEYASAVIRADAYEDPAVVDQRVAVRMARQSVLTRQPPPQLVAILDEAVLRRPVGGPDVHRRQLLRLIEASERPTVTIHVLPFDTGEHSALAGCFQILEFSGGPENSLVYSEGHTGGIFRSKPDDLHSYLGRFEALRAAALSDQQSAAFIQAILNRDA